jgi:hypothetical protein
LSLLACETTTITVLLIACQGRENHPGNKALPTKILKFCAPAVHIAMCEIREEESL